MQDLVEVFKTDVYQLADANHIVDELTRLYPHCRVNFDLEDCDKVLRIQGNNFCTEKIMDVLQSKGFDCGILY